MKIVVLKRLLALMVFLASVSAFSQEKVDTVTMLNGEKKEGKVLSINDSTIKFNYRNETLEYDIKKSEVSSIKFASGRTEMINKALQALPSTVDRKGKVAVLPFEYITNESISNTDGMSRQFQTDTYNSLRENTTFAYFQDPVTTNNLLLEEGLTPENARLKKPAEIAELLGVEYVVYGIATITNKGTSTYGGGLSTYNGKETQKNDRQKQTTKSSGTIYNSNNTATTTNYGTNIDLNIYNDQGVNLYSQSRNSFGSAFDSYHATINYLIKRCPFGSKAKH